MEKISVTVKDDKTTSSDANMNSSDQFYSDEKFIKMGMVRLQESGDEESTEYGAIKKGFLVGMGCRPGTDQVKVVGIHKNSSVNGKTKLESFSIFARAVAEARGGNANIEYAWYGGDAEEICEIIAHGFGTRCKNVENEIGVVLSPANVPMYSALKAEKDENEVRHILMCRVILGSTECIGAGSKQFEPSSTDFDNGVDNPIAPTRYIVWRAYMNSHILPIYVLSFMASSLPGTMGVGTSCPKPSSPSVQLPMFLDELSKFVPPSKMSTVFSYYNEFMQKRCDRTHLIARLRRLVGDELLMTVIKSFQGDQLA